MKVKNLTLSQLFRRSERKTKWLKKLHQNCSPLLNRIDKDFELTPSSLNPPKEGNRFTLKHVGRNFHQDLKRLEMIFGAKFVDGVATVQMRRITVQVTVTS